jgi:hypothetical protein
MHSKNRSSSLHFTSLHLPRKARRKSNESHGRQKGKGSTNNKYGLHSKCRAPLAKKPNQCLVGIENMRPVPTVVRQILQRELGNGILGSLLVPIGAFWKPKLLLPRIHNIMVIQSTYKKERKKERKKEGREAWRPNIVSAGYTHTIIRDHHDHHDDRDRLILISYHW